MQRLERAHQDLDLLHTFFKREREHPSASRSPINKKKALSPPLSLCRPLPPPSLSLKRVTHALSLPPRPPAPLYQPPLLSRSLKRERDRPSASRSHMHSPSLTLYLPPPLPPPPAPPPLSLSLA